MDNGDGGVGQGLAGVQGHQLGIVPLADFAHEHFGQHRAGHTQIARLEAVKVEHWNGAANDGGKLHHAVFVEVGTGHGRVRGAESHRFGADLANAARGTDGLVVQAGAGFFLVSFSPLGVNGERECGAGASDVCSQGRTHGDGSKRGSNHGFEQGTFQVHVSPFGC